MMWVKRAATMISHAHPLSRLSVRVDSFLTGMVLINSERSCPAGLSGEADCGAGGSQQPGASPAASPMSSGTIVGGSGVQVGIQTWHGSAMVRGSCSWTQRSQSLVTRQNDVLWCCEILSRRPNQQLARGMQPYFSDESLRWRWHCNSYSSSLLSSSLSESLPSSQS